MVHGGWAADDRRVRQAKVWRVWLPIYKYGLASDCSTLRVERDHELLVCLSFVYCTKHTCARASERNAECYTNAHPPIVGWEV